MVTPKGHGREITTFDLCTGISLSGSALERHSIVSRNVNLHRCQAQDIISNGNSEWAKLLMQVTRIYIYIDIHIYIYIYIAMRQIDPELREMNSPLFLRLSVLKRPYLSPISLIISCKLFFLILRTLCNVRWDVI